VIDLPHGGHGAQFNERDLVDYIRASRPPRDHIIQGHVKTTLAKHPKRHSLDYWLRKHYSRHPDTMQAVTSVVDALVETGFFVAEEKLLCPDSGRYCKGIRIART
jgi:hypothetical protein